MFYVIVMLLTAPNGQDVSLDAVSNHRFATESECIAGGIQKAQRFGRYSHGHFMCVRHNETMAHMAARHAPTFDF